ncbi:MAG: hypothetical protein KDH89_11705 [Anaerolineae bacterium]|nr:hypothetical protein [Anaerolineae bacterium]
MTALKVGGETFPASLPYTLLAHGHGTTSAPVTTSTADKNYLGYWVKSTATSGDFRGIYLRAYFGGATGGEAGRFYATVTTTNVATGGTVNGIHTSLSINTSSSVSGAGNALRATLGAAAASRTLSGTLAAIQVDSDIGTGNTLPATHAFMRFTNTGAVALSNLFEVPNAANGTIFAAHTTQVMTHSLKIISADGTAYYVMCTNAATNRS